MPFDGTGFRERREEPEPQRPGPIVKVLAATIIAGAVGFWALEIKNIFDSRMNDEQSLTSRTDDLKIVARKLTLERRSGYH